MNAAEARHQMAVQIERWLDLVEGATLVRPSGITAAHFDNFHPIQAWNTTLYDDDEIIPAHLDPSDLSATLDLTMMAGNIRDPGGFSLSRTRAVTLREIRGKARASYPIMVEASWMVVGRDGIGETGRVICGWVKHRKWHRCSKFTVHDRAKRDWAKYGGSKTSTEVGEEFEFDYQVSERIQASIGWQFLHEFMWRVRIGPEGGPALCLPTDATGVKDFLAVRNVESGRARRAALLHWVEQHWRQLRNDPEVETYVRRHLRGRLDFSWGQWSGRILASRFDIRQNLMEQVYRREHRDLRRALRAQVVRDAERAERKLVHRTEARRFLQWQLLDIQMRHEEQARREAAEAAATQVMAVRASSSLSWWQRLWIALHFWRLIRHAQVGV